MAAGVLGAGVLCAAGQPGAAGLGARGTHRQGPGAPIHWECWPLTPLDAAYSLLHWGVAQRGWVLLAGANRVTGCSAHVQALVHLVLDLGELGATLGILWRCLHAYRPLRLGWFRTRLRPLRAWAGHIALACATFPLVDLAAARSQVWPAWIPSKRPLSVTARLHRLFATRAPAVPSSSV